MTNGRCLSRTQNVVTSTEQMAWLLQNINSKKKTALLEFPLPIHDNKEQKLHMHLPSDSAIPLLGIYSEDTPLKVHIYTYNKISNWSTVIEKYWKQPMCPFIIRKGLNKLWCTHTIEYDAVVKTKDFCERM